MQRTSATRTDALSYLEGTPQPPEPDPILITMPPDFRAFCLLYHRIYQQYAQLRLGKRALALTTVAMALGDLATAWPRALSSYRTTAIAWRTLTRRIDYAQRSRPAPDAHCLHELLPYEEADAVALCNVLGHSPEKTDSVTGAEPGTARYLLQAFHRRLDTSEGHDLRNTWGNAVTTLRPGADVLSELT